MGVIHKLRDDVVHFIISQRQENPLFSCRQLAESASEKFGLRLSKSSVHDVLKESGIVTPRGRKPKDKFQIPHEKKKQIQESLSQAKLMPDTVNSSVQEIQELDKGSIDLHPQETSEDVVSERSPEYVGAGKIFLKAALWDLGVYTQEGIRDTDWSYYLTYTTGIRIVLENNTSVFISMPMPLERCVRETVDGLINNIRPFVVSDFAQEAALKAVMEQKQGFKMTKVSIVGQNDHVFVEFFDMLDIKREILVNNRVFVESMERNVTRRAKEMFFSQTTDDKEFIEKVGVLKGFEKSTKDEIVTSLFVPDAYKNIDVRAAAEKLTAMRLYDDQNRLVKVDVEG